jgi:hypothetical protein
VNYCRISVERGPAGLILRRTQTRLDTALFAFVLAAWTFAVGACIYELVTLGGIRAGRGGFVYTTSGNVFCFLCLSAWGAVVICLLIWTLAGSEWILVRDGRLRYELRVGRWTLRRRELDLFRIAKVDYRVPRRATTAVVRIFVKDQTKPWSFANGAPALEAMTSVRELRALLPRDS